MTVKAQKTEIVDELLALGQHYMRSVRTPEQEERFLRDYIEDLAEYPISAIKAGCKAWRHSDATKFPTAGQLVAKVRAQLPDRRPTGDAGKPWAWPLDADYERLSLSEKIRSRLIMASLCRAKAGPMWSSGGPAERPPERQKWLDKAQNHAAEATRQREMLMRAEKSA